VICLLAACAARSRRPGRVPWSTKNVVLWVFGVAKDTTGDASADAAVESGMQKRDSSGFKTLSDDAAVGAVAEAIGAAVVAEKAKFMNLKSGAKARLAQLKAASKCGSRFELDAGMVDLELSDDKRKQPPADVPVAAPPPSTEQPAWHPAATKPGLKAKDLYFGVSIAAPPPSTEKQSAAAPAGPAAGQDEELPSWLADADAELQRSSL